MKMNELLHQTITTEKLQDNRSSVVNAGTSYREAAMVRTTLKQWSMFHAVIDFDGFVSAADRIHVTQSAISHAVAKIQDLLGIPLFALDGRKAKITEEGRILLERSRELLRSAAELERLAESLRQGWGSEIRIAVHPSFPSHLLTLTLQKLPTGRRKIKLSVKEANHEQAEQALRGNSVDLVISTQVAAGFVSRKLGEVEQVAVASLKNPLFALGREITAADLRSQPQIVISDFDDYALPNVRKNFKEFSGAWNVSNLEKAINIMSGGLGYAWLSKHQANHWISANCIRELRFAIPLSHKISMHLVEKSTYAADSDVTKFADALRHHSGEFFMPSDRVLPRTHQS